MDTLLGVLLIGLLTVGFFTAHIFIKRATQRRRAWLQQHGKKIMATITKVQEHITRDRDGNRTGRFYGVTALWDDPETREVYEFSKNVDSSLGYHERVPVPVLIDPKNPRRYQMGIPEVTKKSDWFQQHGKKITATILTVKEWEAGDFSYLVTALWDDPETREVYEFLKVVDDPEAYHPRHPLPVLIDPHDPRNYDVGKPEAV